LRAGKPDYHAPLIVAPFTVSEAATRPNIEEQE
jgi:hypothetical protein